MNESKKNDSRWWAIWEKAGAVGGMDEAEIQSARRLGELPLMGVAEHYQGLAAGKSVLSLGERVVKEGTSRDGSRWTVSEPIISVVVDGHEFAGKVRGKIKIPRRAKPLSRFFPKG